MTTSHGPIRIAIVPVEPASRSGRRQAERAAVAQCLDKLRAADPSIPPYETIAHDPHGAPTLPGWQISITHSRAVAAVAIAREGSAPAFGIDAEEWRDTLLKVIPKFLSPAEIARLKIGNEAPSDKPAAPAQEETAASLLRLWTIKEAVYKACSTPALPLTSIETNPGLTTASTPAAAFSLHPIAHPATTITLAVRLLP